MTRHDENLARLAKIEGQIRGLSRMIREETYCIDILTQLDAAVAALNAVKLRILKKHLDRCVTEAIRGRSESDAKVKIEEVLDVMRRSCK